VSDLEKAPQGASTEDAKDLLIEDRGHVRLLTLNRPHRANALSPETPVGAGAISAQMEPRQRFHLSGNARPGYLLQ
jgi:hypothetical protein